MVTLFYEENIAILVYFNLQPDYSDFDGFLIYKFREFS